MEPAAKLAAAGDQSKDGFSLLTVQMELRWLDVGSWPSFAETVPADAQGNRMAGEGTGVVSGCRNTLVVTADKGHTVAVLGCDDLIIVHTPDATLVMPRDRAEELKTLHGIVAEDLR